MCVDSSFLSPSFFPIPSNVSLEQAEVPSNWSPGHWFLSKQCEIGSCWEDDEQQLKIYKKKNIMR